MYEVPTYTKLNTPKHHVHSDLNAQSYSERDHLIQRASSSLKANVRVITRTDRKVVIKDFSASNLFTRIFLCRWFVRREAAALERMSEHPGTPRLIGRFGKFGFAMELIEGQTLDRKTIKDKPIIMEELEVQIKHMHALGVTHNDIRMSNLMIADNGKLKIIDFGGSILKPKSLNIFMLLIFYITRTSDRIKLVKLKLEFQNERLSSEDLKLARFVSLSRFISRVWKKHIYKALKAKTNC